MAKYSNMTVAQATSDYIQQKYDDQMRKATIDENEFYNSVKAWEQPKGTYIRDMYEIFIDSTEYRKYILEEA